MSAIAELLANWRRELDRVAPCNLAAEIAAGALVVDTRPQDQRERDGELPDAVIIDRNVLEWRLDPTSASRIPQATSTDLRVIVVCNEGYSSSLAAYTLRRLGLHRATDLIDGLQCWLRHGVPMQAAPNPQVDFPVLESPQAVVELLLDR